MSAFIQRRVVGPIKQLLMQGITPQKIALSLVFGILLGIFPVMGTTTLLCTLAALIFRLNQPAIHIVTYLVYPLQLAFILPFIHAGEFVLRFDRTPLSLQQMIALFRANQVQALHVLWRLALHGIFAWLILAAVISLPLYRIILHSITRLQSTINTLRATRSTDSPAEPA